MARLRPAPPPLLLVAARTWGDPARADAATLRELDGIIDGALRETDPARVVRVGTAAVYPDRLSAVREAAWRLVRQGREGREGGPVRRHIGALLHLCLDDYHRGRWAEVLELSEEGLTLCAASGYAVCAWFFQYTKGLVTASRGDTTTAHALAEAMTGWAAPRGVREAVHCAQHVHALADIADGDFDAAFRRVSHISAAGSFPPYVAHAAWVFFELVEAAVRTDRRAEALAHVRALRATEVAGLSSRPALLAGCAEALVADDAAETARLFARALAVPDVEWWPFELARVRLAQGEWLRRSRALSESKGPLTAALRAFEELGSSAWAERARKELRAAGRVLPDAGHDRSGTALTPQEREIAELAASGLTNKQIAERLFISHRTVGAHLYQIYPKLGIASRVALRDALRRHDTD